MKAGKVVQRMLAGLGIITFLAGCSHYYKVNDPAGNREYYTTDIDSTRSGAIKIKDAKSGATVTLQSSEVKEISKEEYETAVKAPAPAPAP